jgi:hypothetical protein
VSGANSFTYSLTTNPGAEVNPGTWVNAGANELTQMATTFFAQGSTTSVYVLELGPGSVGSGVTALTAFITANSAPQFFYAYLVPREWDGNSSFLSLLQTYEGTGAQTYFFVTTTLATYTQYTAQMKDVVALIEAPALATYSQDTITAASWGGGVTTFTTSAAHGVSPGQWFQISGMLPLAYNGWYLAGPQTTGTTLESTTLASNPGTATGFGSLVASYATSSGISASEFSLAAAFWVWLHYLPSSTNKVTPFAWSYLYGVTPFPSKGMSALLTSLYNANINYVQTGAEGGTTNLILYGGHTLDGNDAIFWYSVDYASVNLKINLANTVINGSNNPTNPLYFDPPGIDTLLSKAASTIKTCVTVGLATGAVTTVSETGPAFTNDLEAGTFAGQNVVNAVPLTPYLNANPGDYKIGRYSGLSAQYIPSRGFDHVVFNLVVSQFPTA